MSDSRDRRRYLGQFRLVRLQVVNWGTFTGYKDLPIDERGVLFTGPSGSGKSSLMDAHSVVLLPTSDQRFNASADLSARGAKQATRSIADYVRGAWSETNDEHEQSRVRYLRGGKPTWSAIGAAYSDGLGSTTTAVVVKWFTGTENDTSSLKTLYRLHEGHFDLTALEEWARRGFDTRWLNATHPADTPDTQKSYLDALAKRIGLGISKTARSLLGKAKAMKNVGDLNYFIRHDMLDEPDTFAAAQKMLDAFTPLNEAYEIARRANAQAKVLANVPENWAIYQESQRTRVLAEALTGEPMERYLRERHLRVVEAEIDRLDRAITAGARDLEQHEHQAEQAEAEYLSLARQFEDSNRLIRELDADLRQRRSELAFRERAHQDYSALVGALGRQCPEDEAGFTSLRDKLADIEREARAQQKEIDARRRPAAAAAEQTQRLHDDRAAELQALRSSRTLIPTTQLRSRQRIADGAGVPVTDLPYAAELIDVIDGEQRWRPAAEKVLRNFGLRLLVPERHHRAVQSFIDTNDMRGVVEYSIVPARSHRPAPADPTTLAGKLGVDTDHPCGAWLLRQLTSRFAHVCVESADELGNHSLAVTVRGTVKRPGNHYRKDDRPELTNPASYILGANTEAKLAALEAEVAELAAAARRAAELADELDARYLAVSKTIEAVTKLTGYHSWAELDRSSASEAIRRLEQRITDLKNADTDLRSLEQQRDEAKKHWQECSDTCSTLRTVIADDRRRRERLTEVLERERSCPHSVDVDTDREYLDAVFGDVEVELTPDTLPQVRSAFRKELERRRDAANAHRDLAHSQLKTAIDQFLERWESSAPDNSGDVDRSGADFVALYSDITQRRLPDAMTHFERMISQDMVPSISVLYHAVQAATTEIERRIAMVNSGLRRVEFNPGTHLQIAYKANPSPDVHDFRRRVDALLRGASQALRDPTKLLAQFRQIRDLMKRFTGTGAEDIRWRANVLDVRTGYQFYGREVDAEGVTTTTYRNTASNSGGEQEKLVAFCLAAALSYNLAESGSDGRPLFAPLMLDEAFSKSDETFSQQALGAFDEFGFQLIIAAPIRMSGILEPFIGQAVLVDKRVTDDGAFSHAATATFGELSARGGNASWRSSHAPA